MLKGVKCVLGHKSMEFHEACMRSGLGPPCGIPPTLLQIITRPNKEREEAGVIFSPSSLSACHRQSSLTVEHDWYIDVKQAYKQARGTIFHAGLANEPPPPGTLGVVRELRMQAPISTEHGEQILWGMPDEVVLLGVEQVDGHYPLKHRLHVKITDYKTRTEVGHDLISADKRHVTQINEYAWLVARFLPGWLDMWDKGLLTWEDAERLALNAGVWPRNIDEVIVDELSIVYLDMSRTRTFTSLGFLYDEGKMLGDKIDGKWVRRKPVEHEELELAPIEQMKDEVVEGLIRRGIERQIEAQTMLAPPLTDDEDVRLLCRSCPVRAVCIDVGKREGYNMELQEAIG